MTLGCTTVSQVISGFVVRACEELSFVSGNGKYNQFAKHFVSFPKCQTHGSLPLPSSAAYLPKVKPVSIARFEHV